MAIETISRWAIGITGASLEPGGHGMFTLTKEERELLISALAAWLTIMVRLDPRATDHHQAAITLGKRIAGRA